MTRAVSGSRYWGGLLATLLVAALFNGWVLDTEHFFFADDWGWLARAQFLPWSEAATLFPASIYNDRPGGEFIIRLMYEWSWLNPGPYNAAWLALHAANCGLLYAIAARFLPLERALLASLLAACWFSTLAAVAWVGAIFDLAGATWSLLALHFYLNCGEASRLRWAQALAAIFFHVLAIRTKEFALLLVMVLAAWEFARPAGDKPAERVKRLVPHVLVTVVFLVAYARLYLGGGKEMLGGGVYELSFSASGVLAAIGYYFGQAFYAFTPGLNETNIAAGLVFAFLLLAVATTGRVALAGLLSAAALSAAVLLLARQRHPLYLYVPHFFIAITLCSVAVKSRAATVATAMLALLLLAWPVHTRYWQDARNFVLVKGAYSKRLFHDYADLMYAVPSPGKVRISISESYFDPFSWGQGSAVHIYHRSNAIPVELTTGPLDRLEECGEAGVYCLREDRGRLLRVTGPQ